MTNTHKNKWRTNDGEWLLLALSLCLVSCVSWIMEKPSFTIREIRLSPTSFTEANVLIGLDVQNPNRFDLTIKSCEYVVFLNNKEIGTGRLEKEILVPSSSTTPVRIAVAAKFKDLGGSLQTILTGKDLSYRIEGKAVIKTAFGSRSLPFAKDGRINMKNLFGG